MPSEKTAGQTQTEPQIICNKLIPQDKKMRKKNVKEFE
jgi:hypothetical protein